MNDSSVDPGPARKFKTIVKSDADLERPIRALVVVDGGTVKVSFEDGTDETTPVLPAGFVLACVIKRVWSTGTSASSFIGYF